MHEEGAGWFSLRQEPSGFRVTVCLSGEKLPVFRRTEDIYRRQHHLPPKLSNVQEETLNAPGTGLNNIVRLKTASCPNLTSEDLII